jgi:SAM-dependent methyltransferase
VLTADQIEQLNAHGPYNHGVWRNGVVEITNEEALAGRADFLADQAKAAILRHLDRDELAACSVVDVGCYDGWLLEQGLVDLPFARRVGVEPREKNITKGRVVRDVLGIETRASYRCAGVEDDLDDVFDVVLCTGLMHHLESPGPALRALRRITNRLLFLETHVLPSRHLTPELQSDLEMKDVVYRYSEQASGVSGHKFESSYYDGSADVLGVVSLASIETLQMHLAAAGFENVTVHADPTSYGADDRSYRRWAGVCITATPGSPLVEKDWIKDYEIGMATTVLPIEVIHPLFELIGTDRLMDAVTTLAVPDDRHAAEIIRNLRYNPEDKVRLEYGKALLRESPTRAIEILREIPRTLNADWRATYRAFYALVEASTLVGDVAEADRYRALLATCNPRFPVAG